MQYLCIIIDHYYYDDNDNLSDEGDMRNVCLHDCMPMKSGFLGPQSLTGNILMNIESDLEITLFLTSTFSGPTMCSASF